MYSKNKRNFSFIAASFCSLFLVTSLVAESFDYELQSQIITVGKAHSSHDATINAITNAIQWLNHGLTTKAPNFPYLWNWNKRFFDPTADEFIKTVNAMRDAAANRSVQQCLVAADGLTKTFENRYNIAQRNRPTLQADLNLARAWINKMRGVVPATLQV